MHTAEINAEVVGKYLLVINLNTDSLDKPTENLCWATGPVGVAATGAFSIQSTQKEFQELCNEMYFEIIRFSHR